MPKFKAETMKNIFTFFLLVFAVTISYGGNTGDLKARTPKNEVQGKEIKKDRKMARVYRRANSKVNKELHFKLKSQTKTA